MALAEAVCKLSTRAPSARPSARRVTSRASDYIADAPQVQKLLALSAEKHPQLWSFQARSAFVQRVDASPDQVRKSSCNCLLHRKDVLDGLWCGMSDGCLRIYRIPALDLVSSLPLHQGAITTACNVQKTVWTAGRDGRLMVVDASSFYTVDELPLEGQVVMQLALRGASVYGVTGRCMLLRWDAHTRQLQQKVDLATHLARTCILTDLAMLDTAVWIACGSSLAVLHTQEKTVEPRQNLQAAFDAEAYEAGTGVDEVAAEAGALAWGAVPGLVGSVALDETMLADPDFSAHVLARRRCPCSGQKSQD